jgi:hypothetical protein
MTRGHGLQKCSISRLAAFMAFFFCTFRNNSLRTIADATGTELAGVRFLFFSSWLGLGAFTTSWEPALLPLQALLDFLDLVGQMAIRIHVNARFVLRRSSEYQCSPWHQWTGHAVCNAQS